MNAKLHKFAEWGGCIVGLAGALLLSQHTSYSAWGWVLFLASNCLMITYGYLNNAWGIVVMQIGFSITSYMGIMNWLVR
jgi:hypothetical protein